MLGLEPLESRELLAVALPRIVGVTPPDFSATDATNPIITVTYNEVMKHSDVINAANYLLFNSAGQAVSVDSVTTSDDTTVTINYAGGANLSADTYTLFVRGDQVHEAADGLNLPLATTGQLVAVNSNSSLVSTINAGATSSALYAGAQSYPINVGTNSTVTPLSVVARDFDGDGNTDVAVLESVKNSAGTVTYQIGIYAGTAAGVFNPTSTLQLALPSGAVPSGLIVAGNFNTGSLIDLGVADTNGNIDIFVNTSTPGALSFQAPVAYTTGAGTSPRGWAFGDFDNDGKVDLAVAENGGGITILPGKGNAVFGAPVGIAVAGLTNPSTIAAGNLGSTLGVDLVVGGSNGAVPLFNSSTGTGVFTFTLGATIASGVSVDRVQIGNVRGQTTGALDIVLTTTAATNNLRVFPKGAGGYADATASKFTVNGPLTGLAVQDVSGDNKADIIVTTTGGSTSFGTGGSVAAVFISKSTLSLVSLAPEVDYAVDNGPVFLANQLPDINKDGNPDILTINSSATTGPSFTVLNGTGSGTFNEATTMASGGTSEVTVQGAPNLTFNPRSLLGTSANNDQIVRSAGSWVTDGFQVGQTIRVRGVSDQDNGDYTILGVTPTTLTVNSVNQFNLVAGAGMTISTAPPTTVSAGGASVIAGDLNGDGISDLVVVDYATNDVTVYLATSPGVYGAGKTYSTLDAGGLGQGPISVALADLTHTGKVDIITANSLDNTISILANNGSGVFAQATTVSVGPGPTQVIATDFNNDGKMDLAVAHNASGPQETDRGVTILLGNGDRTFATGKEVLSDVQATALVAGDFIPDAAGNLDLVVADKGSGSVVLARGDGTGNFTQVGSFLATPDIVGLAAADFNRDGYLDVVAVSGSTSSTAQIAVLLNNQGNGFNVPITTTLPFIAPVYSVAVSDLNGDAFPDLVIGTVGSTAPILGAPTVSNVYTLTGNGDGTFGIPAEFEAGGEPGPAAVGVVSDPLVRAVTFHKGGALVVTNLVQNGNFEQHDLSGEAGNLSGWLTASVANSRGGWAVQYGPVSPLSGTTVPLPGPTGLYRAMLDQPNLVPIPPNGVNPNAASTYQGSNFLYQDVNLPSVGTGTLTLSLDLYVNTGGIAFTNPVNNPSLVYNSPSGLPNYQVRVDVLDASDPDITDVTVGAGHVLANIFQSKPSTAAPVQQTLTLDLTAYAGKTIRLRIAGVTNQGRLIVGVDNVSIKANYTDSVAPTASGIQLRNPGYLSGASPLPTTTDPTIIGKVADDGGVNNMLYVAFASSSDPTFTGPEVQKDSVFDANGNFSFTLSGLLSGPQTEIIRVADKAGNHTDYFISFIFQGTSNTNWQSLGPGPINTLSSGQEFPTVSGNISAIAVDTHDDPTGNTYYVGTANGGVWKTSNGGQSWTPLTDFVTDTSGNPVAEPIAALAIGPPPSTVPFGPSIVYAATGAGDLFPDAQGSAGILRSIDGGLTWSVLGTVAFAGARISKMAVDPNNSNIVYVAVESGGFFGAGVYRTLDGGQSWYNVLTPATMGLAAGTALASVTDLFMNPADSTNVYIGLGNIGLLSASTTGGVWVSNNANQTTVSWRSVVGGNNPSIPNNTLPSGKGVGRVTVAEAGGVTGNVAVVYVMISDAIATPYVTGGQPANYGTFGQTASSGLFKSSDGGKNFTKVLLKEFQNGAFNAVTLMSRDAGNVGAMAIDPTDPNVVWIGGSVQFYGSQPAGVPRNIIRIDTGDMRDANYTDPVTKTIPNDGDDIQKVAAGVTGQGVPFYVLGENSLSDIAQGEQPIRVPPGVRALAFDSQGRLLIGTEEGIYRAVSYGVGYDYSSGGHGGAPGGVPHFTVKVSTINGNLQISDLTSASPDPLLPGRVYTTAWQTGSAITAGGLTWATAGIRGAQLLGNDPHGTPDGTVALAAAPDPNAPPGTLATLYRLFAFDGELPTDANGAPNPVPARPRTVLPETSSQGGENGTYVPLSIAGLSVSDNAAYQPVLALFPQKVFDSGKFQDELLLGTDRIYTTRTGSALWNDKVGKPLSAGAVVVAAAFSPTNDQVIYAATSDGKVFVTFNGGGDGWPEQDGGLPAGGTITSILVDQSNTQTAFLTLNNSTGGHVFKTVNGGLLWTDITGNLPKVSSSPTKTVNVYSLAEDPRVQVGAPSGRLYVGTAVGVYVSLDDTTWQRLGLGMPNVPVVGLQWNQNLEELVAATGGRGAFLISTDHIGPHVVSVSPATPVSPGLSSVTVTFNEAINPATFTTSQIDFITTPSGTPIDLTKVTVTDVSVPPPFLPNPHNTFQITFPTQMADGVYTFQIGPNIQDAAGNPMDQNQNGINGENPADRFTFNVAINSTDNGRFVTGLFNDLLNRSADTNGFITILTPIDQARFALLPGFATSYLLSQGRSVLIQDLYQSGNTPLSTIGIGDLLGRAAVTSEVNFWLGQLQQGTVSVEGMLASLVSDVSYFNQNRPGHVVAGNDTNFVNQIYLDLMQRAAVSTEVTTLVGNLTNAEAASRTQDARNLLAGQPYQGSFIVSAYNTYLGRNPGMSELNFWLTRFLPGPTQVTQEALIASLLGSPEYFNRTPTILGTFGAASNTTWTQAVYKQLFPSYTISSGELNLWVGLLNAGQVTREQIANILDTSSLYRIGIVVTDGTGTHYTGLVNQEYVTYLGRNATSAEIANWAAVYSANPNYRTEDLIATLLGSGEYFTNHIGSATTLGAQDAAWADALYTSVLGAPNPGAEASIDLPFLANAEQIARQADAALIVTSPEYKDRLTTRVYGEFLGRLPAAAELATWRPVVGTAASVVGGLTGDEQLLAGVLGSQEYFMLQGPDAAGLHTNDTWLRSLYPALGIPFDATGEAANLAALDADYATQRLAAIRAFTSSPEYQTDFITSAYSLYLGRNPSAAEISFWLGRFLPGPNQVTQEALIGNLLGSAEYFFRAPTILGTIQAPSNTTFVQAVFKQLFPGYIMTTNDLNTWVGALNGGTMTREQVADALDTSNLYRFGSPGSVWTGTVNLAYVKYLRRSAAPSEIAAWQSAYALNPKLRTEDFIATLLVSQEYFQDPHPFP
jgi:hypothetical protein